ncbi:MAG: cell wall-binding repeat-containing protein [Desulfosporosinus sp.]|nr:cell wall-binding repeat-containing protein [Desulfosporosinus sp.]
MTISSASTNDNGATYTIDAMLTEGKTYTVTAAKTGYTFGTAQNVVVPAAPVPTITGISPASGPAAGGDTITINGTNLSVVNAVYFGSTSATSFNLGSDTSLTAVAPAGSGTVDVTVYSLGGTSTTSSSDRFTYIRENPPAPTLSLLTLNGNIPNLTVGEAVYNLNNLTLSGEDQYHNPFSLAGQAIQWNLATGGSFANLTGSTLTPLAAGSGTVTATVYGVTSNTLGFNILTASIPAPQLLSEATNSAGTEIILTFDKPMADPSGNSGHIAVDVTRSGATVSESVSQISLDTDSTKLDLNLSQALLAGDTISISYTPGTLTGTDGGMLAAISQRTVTNNAPLAVTTNTVTVSDNQSNLAITADTIVSAGDNPVTVTVPESVTGASLNLATLLQAPVGGTVTSSSLPALNVNTTVDLTNGGGGTPVNVQVAVPSGTTVSAPVNSGWDGTIQVPTIQASNSVTVTPSSGTTATVESVIEVGYGDVPLTFSKAVRILIPGQAGSKVGYVRSGTFYPITNVLSADTQSLANSVLGAGQDGYINVGNDLIIWTKHFTKFITYRETALNTGGNSGSSRGGGGGGTIPVTLSSIAITTPAAKLSYTVGDTLDLSSLVVTGTMSNNSTQVELVTAANVTGFNSSVPATGQVLTITIGGKTTTYTVNIIAASGIPERIGGMNRYDTAVQIAKVYFTAGTDTVILARGDISADALTAVPLARHDNAPLLLTESGQIPAEVLKEIQDLGAKKVILMGGTAAISQNVADTLIANISGIALQRIAGTDRYDTAYQTAKLLGSQGEAVLVSSSDNAYPDALSVSSWAAYHKVPILYVDPNGGNQLPQATAQALKEFNVQRTTLVGGTGVLPQALESILPDPVRYAGDDRFATNVQVLKALQPNPVHIFVASGNDFADALAGAVVAGQSNSWLLLKGANGGSVNGLTLEQQNLLQNTKGSILDLHVFGGTAAVPDSTLTEMKNLLGL